jgi:hypothetical protein
MLEKNLGLLYFLKHSKVKNSDYKYVYLKITVNGVSKLRSVKRHWVADKWDQSKAGQSEQKRLRWSLILIYRIYPIKFIRLNNQGK